MVKHLKLVLTATSIATAGIATAALAQAYLDPQIAYSYDYYADAEKTIYLGHTFDRGCIRSGSTVRANRVQVPTQYFDATPSYVCTLNGPYLPPDWGLN